MISDELKIILKYKALIEKVDSIPEHMINARRVRKTLKNT